MKNTYQKLLADERGGIVEYAIIIALLAVVAIGGLTFLGPKVKDLFDKAGEELDKGQDFTY